jgi:malate dehydrogenase (oxaloacetate-decarboxylating)(NADP+)
MKIAAARALADLARQQVPEEVARRTAAPRTAFGVDYIIPAPFDPRLMEVVARGRRAGRRLDSGVAQRPITTWRQPHSLRARLNPTPRC